MNTPLVIGALTGLILLGVVSTTTQSQRDGGAQIENTIEMNRKQRRKWMRQQDPDAKIRDAYCGYGYHPVFRKESGVMKIHCRKD